MAYAIYFIKMQLMSDRFLLSNVEATGVKRMAEFFSLFHLRPFLQSRLVAMAPAVDLQYLSLMNIYKEVDEKVAIVATQSIFNHLWYLTEEIVIFSLFDERLSDELRQEMVDTLISFPRPINFPTSKPKFPSIDLDSIRYPQQLTTFIGRRSWLLFHLLQLKDEKLDWMMAPVKFWGKMVGYRKVRTIVRAFEVVNDCAERAIKMITDFKESTATVDEQEYLIQVVEDYRRKIDLSKKSGLCA